VRAASWRSGKPDRTQHLAKVKQIQIACHVLIWSTNDRTFTHTQAAMEMELELVLVVGAKTYSQH